MKRKKIVLLMILSAFLFYTNSIICENIEEKIKIEASSIDEEFKKLPENIKAQYEEEELRKEIKMQLQEEKILRLEAERLGYDKKESYIKDIEELKSNLLIASLIDDQIMKKIEVEDSEIKSFYDENKEMFDEGESVEARHILLNTAGLSEEEKDAVKKKGEELLRKAIDGENFEKLAKENSEGPTASVGGYLGWFKKGDMVEEFEKASFECEKGKVYPELVESVFGYHIIYVEDKQLNNYVPYENIKEELKENILNKKRYDAYISYIENLRKKYGV